MLRVTLDLRLLAQERCALERVELVEHLSREGLVDLQELDVGVAQAVSSEKTLARA